MNFERAKVLFAVLAAALVIGLTSGCMKNPVSAASVPLTCSQATVTSSSICLKPADIVEFKADAVPARTHFKDFKVERETIEEILRTWYKISQEHWLHGYSHVALEDRTGIIKMKNGTTVRWMVRPGGLAEFVFQDGATLHLARELVPWKNGSEKILVAYTFLLEKVQGDNVNLIASRSDKNLDLIQKIIRTNKLGLEVENYSALERGADFCYYSKYTKEIVAIIDVTEKGEKSYYLNYYTGPEGGASKEIIIENRDGEWIVVNDDGKWIIK